MKESKAKTLKLYEYINKELIESVAFLLDEVIAGKVHGVIVVSSKGNYHHEMMLLGSYNSDPYSASRAVNKLKDIIENKATELEEHAIIEHQY